jgi:hypothetical protein
VRHRGRWIEPGGLPERRDGRVVIEGIQQFQASIEGLLGLGTRGLDRKPGRRPCLRCGGGRPASGQQADQQQENRVSTTAGVPVVNDREGFRGVTRGDIYRPVESSV